MVEDTQRSKRPGKGATMDLPSTLPQRLPAGLRCERPPASKHDSPGHSQIHPGASGNTEGLLLQLSGLQHAQITQVIMEQDHTGVAVVGADGKIKYANRALTTLLQYQKHELDGKALADLVGTLGCTRTKHGEVTTLAGERQGSPVVKRLVSKSGETIPCLIDSHAIRDEAGKATHSVVFVTNAHSRNDAAQADYFAGTPYESLSLQVLGMLAGGVAHDFNNALEVIIGFASLARIRLSAADPLHEPLKIIEESAKGAADLARQLLTVSKDKPDDKQFVNVADLINAVIAIISRTFDRKIRIEHRIEPDLPSINGFRNRLEQAILNLCINARDALQDGGSLTLEATSQVLNSHDPRIPPSSRPGNYVRISVRDSGMGMTAETMEKIFAPRFTTKETGRGSGLGLTMVNRIIKEARGFISVASRPAEGSEFSLFLPAANGREPRPLNSTQRQPISGRGRVLVVDDEPRVLEFLEKGLTRLGYEAISAESGNQACEIFLRQCNEIDCILLDMIMPGISGLETYGRLRKINPRVRVILSSGYTSGHVKQEAVEGGGPEFLEKPYTLEELSRVLQKIQKN